MSEPILAAPPAMCPVIEEEEETKEEEEHVYEIAQPEQPLETSQVTESTDNASVNTMTSR